MKIQFNVIEPAGSETEVSVFVPPGKRMRVAVDGLVVAEVKAPALADPQPKESHAGQAAEAGAPEVL